MGFLKIFRQTKPAISKEQAINIARADFIVQGWRHEELSSVEARFSRKKKIWDLFYEEPDVIDGAAISAKIDADTGEIIDAVIYYRPHGGTYHRDPNIK